MNWIELHTDTYGSQQLSFLDGAQIVSLCAKHGCGAVACTDRNSILSYLAMEREAERRGIRLIYGVTLDCADLDDRYAVTLLAKNEAGRRNIFTLMRLLEENQFPCGRCVTRQQIEDHRDGLLLGASAVDGQLIRAIQLRCGTRRLKQIAGGYDYLELPLEPYDTAAQLLQLAKKVSIPLCAVQNARLGRAPSETEIQTFQTISYDAGSNERPAPYLPPEKLAEQFRALYVLPGEREEVERALSQGPAQIIEQIEPLESLRRLLSRNEDAAERERQKQLRAQAEAALRRKYGEHPAPGIVQRFNWELERFEQLGMAGQVLLMQEIVQTAHEAGGRVSIAGTWNSSFLLSLLEITELNPLPPELDPNGFDLCPVALLGTKEGLLSADLRLPGEVIPLVRERAAKQHGNQLLQIQRMVRAPRAEDEINALIEQYLTDCCSKETAEALREDGAFYYAVRGHSGRMEMAPVLSSLHLLPETADPSALPIAPDTPEYGLRMASFGPNQLDHIPSVLLIGVLAQSVLMRCAASTSVPFQGIPLDGESVYMTLGEAYRTGDMETPVAAACDLLGVRVNEFDMELYRAMGVVDLHSLIRFMNLAHSTGHWQDNQQTLLQDGTLCPAQLITCREDVYRYLLERGASPSEAADFMESVWRGKAARTGYSEAQRALLQKCKAETWFIQVCQNIGYLFPESHSAEYAVSLVHLIWYIRNKPETGAIVLEERAAYTA